jgi:tetratricopeptide (TPR) repeat protein
MDANVLLTQARRALQQGGHAEGAALARQVLDKHPQSTEAMTLLVASYVGAKRHAEAKKWVRRILSASPGDEAALAYQVTIQLAEGQVEEARRTVRKARRLRPSSVKLRALELQVLNSAGEREEAADAAAEIVASGIVDPLVAREFATAAPRVHREPEAAAYLRRCLESAETPPSFLAGLWVQLGRLLDRMDEPDEAFEAWTRGNALRRSEFDAGAFSARIDETIRNWTRDAIAERAGWGDPSDRPVLIVGMPRSGTTLVEQILGSHPEVAPCGELNDLVRAAGNLAGLKARQMALVTDPGVLRREDVSGAARDYVRRLRRAGARAKRATDKMPLNFLNLGLVAIMTPHARVVHCVRDARDVCLSCYSYNFSGHMPFSHDLRDLGMFHLMHDRLMAHWREVLDVPILELRYEELVADQEGQSRALVDFVGLGWDEACLSFYESKRSATTASYEQVRNPIYKTAVERWRRYERHLAPLLEALGPESGGV